MDWTTSLPDWEERIVSGKSMIPVAPLFPDVAADAMDVFGALRMVDADGSPLMSEACLPWVNELVAALFGSYDPEKKRRLITNYFLIKKKVYSLKKMIKKSSFLKFNFKFLHAKKNFLPKFFKLL